MRLLKLFNKSEMECLNLISKSLGDVFIVAGKVRVADVFEIQGSGIDVEMYSYALKAHFDFVVYDKLYVPIMAIEFDGPSHKKESQVVNDDMKNELCRKFNFPLLRLNDNWLSKDDSGVSIVECLLSSFVDYSKIVETNDEVGFVYDCFNLHAGDDLSFYRKKRSAQKAIKDKFESGKLHSHDVFYSISGDQKSYRAEAWVEVERGRFVSTSVSIRHWGVHWINPIELLEVLVHIQLWRKVEHWLRNGGDLSLEISLRQVVLRGRLKPEYLERQNFFTPATPAF